MLWGKYQIATEQERKQAKKFVKSCLAKGQSLEQIQKNLQKSDMKLGDIVIACRKKFWFNEHCLNYINVVQQWEKDNKKR